MWDAFQQEVLAALGHTVYARRARSDDAQPAGAVASGVGPREPQGEVSPALLQALARAAGVAIEALPPLPPLDTPAGKRALWPQLRRLRRERR